MKGYVESSKGLRVSERKLRRLLPSIAPIARRSRQTSSYERRNPSVYGARYFGHKIHLDQNEKLVHYGVTYIFARDGYSGKVVGNTVMPRKNNQLIYENVHRKAILEYGLWDQVRVDHGREYTWSCMSMSAFALLVEETHKYHPTCKLLQPTTT